MLAISSACEENGAQAVISNSLSLQVSLVSTVFQPSYKLKDFLIERFGSCVHSVNLFVTIIGPQSGLG
jgi:hypothetical protein